MHKRTFGLILCFLLFLVPLISAFGYGPETLNGNTPKLTGSEYLELRTAVYARCFHKSISLELGDKAIEYMENILGIKNGKKIRD